ncbi:hypothetical protein QR685DRAFT_571899 [Neurospora intermedia]|uniref:Uncharacterized protein n=1 Tax=Neurospora intermedia TaxID=5142 RepID=A0ABR3DGG8_NEUIN
MAWCGQPGPEVGNEVIWRVHKDRSQFRLSQAAFGKAGDLPETAHLSDPLGWPRCSFRVAEQHRQKSMMQERGKQKLRKRPKTARNAKDPAASDAMTDPEFGRGATGDSLRPIRGRTWVASPCLTLEPLPFWPAQPSLSSSVLQPQTSSL